MKLRQLSQGNLDRIRFTLMNQVFEPEQVIVQDQVTDCPRSGQAYVAATAHKEAYCGKCFIFLVNYSKIYLNVLNEAKAT